MSGIVLGHLYYFVLLFVCGFELAVICIVLCGCWCVVLFWGHLYWFILFLVCGIVVGLICIVLCGFWCLVLCC